jgi:hypothetical protein
MEQRQDALADGVDGRLVTDDKQGGAYRHHLVVGEPFPRRLVGGETRHDRVVGRRLCSREQHVEVVDHLLQAGERTTMTSVTFLAAGTKRNEGELIRPRAEVIPVLVRGTDQLCDQRRR